MGTLDKRSWVGLSALAVGVVILLIVIFSSVRDAGQQFLNLFRVQQVQTIQITQEFLDSSAGTGRGTYPVGRGAFGRWRGA